MPGWIKQSAKTSFGNRWMVLMAAIWMECCAGASYGFGIYSEDLKTNFGYNQKDLEIISFFKDVGECVGIIPGLIYERFPPWVVLLIGALQNHAGYLMIWLALTNGISRPAFWQICLYICMAVNSQAYFTTAALVTSVRNFPANRGIVIGLLKGCIGLSGAILTRLWRAMPLGDGISRGGSSFLLLLSILPSLVAFLSMPVIRPIHEEDHNRDKSVIPKFVCLSVPIVFLAVFLMVSTLSTGFEPATNRILGFAVILILGSPVAVLSWRTNPELGTIHSSTERLQEPFISNMEGGSTEARNPTEDGIQNHAAQRTVADNGKSIHRCNTELDVGNRSPLCKIFFSPDFILVLLSSATALGAGFVAINNAGQVASSQRYTGRAIDVFISMISIWQFLGRFGAGALSDYVLRRWAIPRPLLIAVGSALLSFSYMLIATSLAGTLYMGSILIGFCFGSVYSLVPTVTSDLFGLEHFASLYNIVLMGNPVVSYILSVWVAGYLYDREAENQRRRECEGKRCFDLSFNIMGGVGLLATCGFVMLWRRSKKLYGEK